ncbi:MAG: ATP-binding protein [Boseongicola sp. SB0662_bin_57]|nr:ATP-binding protein [Boseongicola sp. SB0662_bin_57]
MLVEFSVQNHRSFRDRQSFLMTASNSGTPNAVATGNNGAPRVLQQACLFGANGSGKSGLVGSMKTVCAIVRNSFKNENTLAEEYEPHLFHSEWRDAPTEFEVTFLHDDSLFQYGFAYDAERIWEEWLFERPSATRKQRQIFTREFDPESDTYRWETSATHLKGERESWKAQTRDNALFLSTAVQLNAKPLKRPANWLRRGFRTIPEVESVRLFTARHLDNDDWKKRVMAFLAETDLRLEDVEAKERSVPETARFKNLPRKQQSQLKSMLPEGATTLEIFTFRKDETGEKMRLDFEDESSGTRVLFWLIGPIMDSLDNGYTLVVDELNTHVHPLAFRHISRMFCSSKTNPRKAQLIFTTHDTTVTEEDCIGRDQIWLVEKGDDLASRLVPFSDYRTRDERPFRRGYLQGRYGAVPRVAEQQTRASDTANHPGIRGGGLRA